MKAWEKLKGHWTKGTFARNRDGVRVPPEEPCAELFCMMGIIRNRYFDVYERENIYHKIRLKIGSYHICAWNDSHTEDDVIKVLKELDV